jgi:hypothetical protein
MFESDNFYIVCNLQRMLGTVIQMRLPWGLGAQALTHDHCLGILALEKAKRVDLPLKTSAFK